MAGLGSANLRSYSVSSSPPSSGTMSVAASADARMQRAQAAQESNELLLSKGSQLQEKLARLEMIFGGSDGHATPTSGDRPFGE